MSHQTHHYQSHTTKLRKYQAHHPLLSLLKISPALQSQDKSLIHSNNDNIKLVKATVKDK